MSFSPLHRPYVLRVHTEPLLVSIATPDFSMPYNVICFVCTVIAIGFGSIFNLTTKVLVPETDTKSPGLLARLLSLFRLGKKNQQEKPMEDTNDKKKNDLHSNLVDREDSRTE